MQGDSFDNCPSTSTLGLLIRLQCRHNDLIRGDVSWDVSYAPLKINYFSVLNCLR